MNKFQRIRDILFSVLILLFAAAIMLVPDESYESVAAIVGLLLLVYGFRLLMYYFRMARHMVDGKTILYEAIIVLDLALFTGSLATMDSFIILFYLFGIYAFAGFIGVLRAFESKRIGGAWKSKLITGIVSVSFALVMLVAGVVLGNKNILVYGFSLSLVYTAAARAVNALKKTAIVYIQ